MDARRRVADEKTEASPDEAEREASPNGDAPPERSRIRVQRGSHTSTDVETTEIVRGTKPGSRFARRVRPGERRFERGAAADTFTATHRATEPRSLPERVWRGVRRVAMGSPISSEELEEQRLPKTKALAVFSSDALSSSAYATDEILLVLAAAGTGALTHSIPIALAIVALLAVVTFSYRQTISAYPTGGGAYIVARDNFGDFAGITAAAGLSVGYILTVAVSVAAGVFAVVSAVPELADYKMPMALGAVALVTVLNLRGIRESGTIFAIPTYGFILAFGGMIIAGFVRMIIDPDLRASEPPGGWHEAGSSALTVFLVLRAFSMGSAALTGVEAISNGIPAFKKPEPANAATTLTMMALILGLLFAGITVLARQFDIQHGEEMSVPAQIGRTVFGETPVFYLIQAFTALILFLAANTAYADFPRLASILSRDRFLPHQFMFRGDRLAFTNGILLLGATAAALLVIFRADVNELIPLYAFGVFLSFTLSQTGMVRHWFRLKAPGWVPSAVISGVGGVTTGVVAVIVGTTNFAAGAWISMVAIAILALVLWSVYRHYQNVHERLAVPEGAIFRVESHRQAMLIPVDEINQAVMRSLAYARSLSPNVTAIHVTDDMESALALRKEWEAAVLDVPLKIINSPYRSFVKPVVSYIDALDRADPGQYVTVVLPEYLTPWFWQRPLHNQSARRLKSALMERPNTVIVEVPYHLTPPGGDSKGDV